MRPPARDTERLMRLVRWLGVAFTLVQFTLYQPSPGIRVPFPQVPVGLAMASVLAAGNLLAWRYAKRMTPAGEAAQLVADTGFILAVIWLFSFDAGSALWALLVLPVLEGALRRQLRGAMLTWGGLSVAYVVREIWATYTYPDLSFYIDSVTYRLGLVAIVAAATGSLASRLRAELAGHRVALAEAEALRVVATAATVVTGQAPDQVFAGVTDAARRLGDGSELWVRDGEGTWSVACRSGASLSETAVLPFVTSVARARATDADARTPQARLLACPVRTGGDVAAVLLVTMAPDRRVSRSLVEAVELLGVATAAGFAEARRRQEERRFSERLRRQALHDALTGLPNRAQLRQRVTAALASTSESAACAALVLLDLDRFKEVNDTLGHLVGDALLVETARRLQAALRADDVVARLGGDEFVVLLTNLPDAHAAVPAAERLAAGLREPFFLDGVALDIEASLGVAVAPKHGETFEQLLQRADIAMYVAKESRIGLSVYAPELDRYSPARLALLGELRSAIEGDDLVLHYQPKAAMADGSVRGVEALVRWQHPTHGLLGPGEFIPLAERSGLIRPLTLRVLADALAQARRWRDSGRRLSVAVNVSTRCLLDRDFPYRVAELLADSDVPAALLELEITESAVMADPDRALDVLMRLAQMGVRLAIDDFGTGYSSMAYLKRLPVHALKIDRTFVHDMAEDASDASIVASSIDLARNLGLSVVAEGVETEGVWRSLARLGCETAQGYYLSRPLPAGEFERWLADRAAPSQRLAS